jgi:hypothetical protein
MHTNRSYFTKRVREFPDKESMVGTAIVTTKGERHNREWAMQATMGLYARCDLEQIREERDTWPTRVCESSQVDHQQGDILRVLIDVSQIACAFSCTKIAIR